VEGLGITFCACLCWPDPKCAVFGGVRKVFVRGEKRKVVPDAQLRKQCIDGADLNAALAADVAQRSSTDVIVSAWLKHWESREAFDDLRLRLGTREALQELLEHKARSHNDLRTEQGVFEVVHFWL